MDCPFFTTKVALRRLVLALGDQDEGLDSLNSERQCLELRVVTQPEALVPTLNTMAPSEPVVKAEFLKPLQPSSLEDEIS